MGLRTVKRLLGLLAVWAGYGACAGVPAVVHAQTSASTASKGDLERQYDEAFQEMLRKPADLDVLFKFATIASQTGDLEGAISALERMLLVNQDLPRVRLELGVLYFRLGSYEVAQTYLETALQSPTLPPDVRSRAEDFLAQIKNRRNPSHFSGEAFLGLRYQSNANLGPANSAVLLFGQVANLNQAAIGTPDWGAVSSVQLRHTYDFGKQDRSTLETLFTAYANRQFQVAAANVSLLDLTTGPRFQVLSGIFEDASVKIFGTGGAIWVNDSPYYVAYGAGIEGNILLANGLRSITTAVFRRQEHSDTAYLPTNSLFTGGEYSANTILQYQLTPIVSVFGSGSMQRFASDLAPWQSYQLWGIGGGMSFRFVDPILRTGLPWTVSLTVGQQWWHYDEPDVVVDPNTYRNQSDFIGNLTLAVPFDERTTVTFSGGRFARSASVPNYAFDNNTFMLGVSWRF